MIIKKKLLLKKLLKKTNKDGEWILLCICILITVKIKVLLLTLIIQTKIQIIYLIHKFAFVLVAVF